VQKHATSLLELHRLRGFEGHLAKRIPGDFEISHHLPPFALLWILLLSVNETAVLQHFGELSNYRVFHCSLSFALLVRQILHLTMAHGDSTYTDNNNLESYLQLH
jgi:hypothetical protein